MSVVLLVAKATVILGLAGMSAAVLRNASAAVRHSVWTVALVSVLVLPVAMAVAPQWRVAVLPATQRNLYATADAQGTIDAPPRMDTRVGAAESRRPDAANANRSTTGVVGGPVVGAPNPPLSSAGNARTGRFEIDPTSAVYITWLAGTAAVLGWLLLGRLAVGRVARRASAVDYEWARLLEIESRRAGLHTDVRLVHSSAVMTPVTFGIRHPVILLPEDARTWSDARRTVVLRHELAHIARGDALTQLAAGIACAVYWFHPVVWVAATRLRVERERASDDRVLALGTAGAEYASHLLDVARVANRSGAPPFVAIAMARPSHFEGRLIAILDESRKRGMTDRRTRSLALGGVALAMFVVSAFQPVPRIAVDAGTKAKSPTSHTNTPLNALVSSAKQPVTAAQEPGTRSIAARNGGKLIIDITGTGRVNISGWNEPSVNVRVADGSATARLTSTGNTIHLRSSGDAGERGFFIRVPKEFDIQFVRTRGHVLIEDVGGEFTGRIQQGGIAMRRVRGTSSLATSDGDVYVDDSDLGGTVSAGAGSVFVTNTDGGVRGISRNNTYSNADVTLPGLKNEYDPERANADRANGQRFERGTAEFLDSVKLDDKFFKFSEGRRQNGAPASITTYRSGDFVRPPGAGFPANALRMSKSGGRIQLDEPLNNGGWLTTGGGAITVAQSYGPVYAKTGGGDIAISSLGDVWASTGSGDVIIRQSNGGDVEVETNNGNVTLLLSDFEGTYDIEAAYTKGVAKPRVEAPSGLRITETENWDRTEGTERRYVRARGTIGNGSHHITIRALNGNVTVRSNDR